MPARSWWRHVRLGSSTRALPGDSGGTVYLNDTVRGTYQGNLKSNGQDYFSQIYDSVKAAGMRHLVTWNVG